MNTLVQLKNDPKFTFEFKPSVVLHNGEDQMFIILPCRANTDEKYTIVTEDAYGGTTVTIVHDLNSFIHIPPLTQEEIEAIDNQLFNSTKA